MKRKNGEMLISDHVRNLVSMFDLHQITSQRTLYIHTDPSTLTSILQHRGRGGPRERFNVTIERRRRTI